MRTILIGFASSLHGRVFYESSYKEIVDTVSSLRSIDVLENIVTGYDKRIADSIKDYDLVLSAVLTGGTSRIIYKYFRNRDKPVVLIAYSKHNSLASALSAKAKLSRENAKANLIYFRDRNELLEELALLLRASAAAHNLGKLTVLEINEGESLSSDANWFMENIGGKIAHIHIDDLWRISRRFSDEIIGESLARIREYVDLSGTEKDRLFEVIRLYHAMRHLAVEHGATAIVIDCFPLVIRYKVTPCLAVSLLNTDGIPTACENDYNSLISLYLSLTLTGSPGWVANPSGATSDGYLRFAHCTMAANIGNKCLLVPHFESGHPYAVSCSYVPERFYFIRFEKDDVLVVYRGKKIASGLLEPGYCRSQLIIDAGPYGYKRFIENATGNHHVFIPYVHGLGKMLKYVAWWRNWKLEIRN